MNDGTSLPPAFARAAATGALADAWLLLAPGRERARAAALACAARLLGIRGDPRRHADCAVFDPRELEVDGLRVEHVAQRNEGVPSVEAALRYKPLAGAWRAVLLLDADRMSHDAQGALLKTAEEPPQGSVLILTACDLGAFLPALRSRCRVVRLGAAVAADLERLAQARGLLPEVRAALTPLLGDEALLELGPEEQAFLHERVLAWQAALRGEAPAEVALAPLEDLGRGAEARQRLRLLLQTLLAASAREAARQPRAEAWLDPLDEALADLEVSVSPSLILATLRNRAAQAAQIQT